MISFVDSIINSYNEQSNIHIQLSCGGKLIILLNVILLFQPIKVA